MGNLDFSPCRYNVCFQSACIRYKLTYIIMVKLFCFMYKTSIADLLVNMSLQTGYLKMPFLLQVQFSQCLCCGECVEY
jgi:hypothetical protein